MLENELPKDNIIEKSVLGTIIKYGTDALIEVIGDLDQAYFYDGGNLKVYQTILDLFYESEPVDPKTVAAKLGSTVDELIIEAVDRDSLIGYVEALKRFYIRRFLIQVGSELTFLGFSDKESTARELLNLATATLLSSDVLDAGGGFKSVNELALEAKNRIEKLRESPELPGYSTGLDDLDFILGGLQGGDLVIIAGRPGSGKTALMVSITTYIAMNGGKVGIFSYEMEGAKLVDRVVAQLANLNLQFLRTAQVPEDRIDLLYRTYDYIRELPIHIDDSGKGNIGYILGKTKQLALQNKLDILCLDYLQLVPEHKKDTRNNILGEITQRLKNLAMELHIPILLLSQLSRAVESRDNKRPILADLRDSGNIEQDADIVIFVYRPEMYGRTEANEGKAELVVAKNRFGPPDIVRAEFVKEVAFFKIFGGSWNG